MASAISSVAVSRAICLRPWGVFGGSLCPGMWFSFKAVFDLYRDAKARLIEKSDKPTYPFWLLRHSFGPASSSSVMLYRYTVLRLRRQGVAGQDAVELTVGEAAAGHHRSQG
jgi:hypothetical protein